MIFNEYKDGENNENSIPGTLNHETISRFIKKSTTSITIINRNILAKCSKREFDISKDHKKKWLEAIKDIYKTNINMNVSEEIKKNTINDIISYTKSYVKHCINDINGLKEFLDVLKGTNFNLKLLLDIINEINLTNLK